MISRFLQEWLGAWPPTLEREIVPWALRDAPGWDGKVRPVQGVSDGSRWMISVSPTRSTDGIGLFEGVFRWTETPAALEEAGQWLPRTDPVVPTWLRPFNGDVLVELDDDGTYLAGVGLKRHLPSGWELSVGTEEAARGRGLARRLVATAARYCLDHGAVPIYLHADDNVASAKAAVAAGFPDQGWRVLAVADETGEA
jgi:GNAT superfamily N-acetyltransferase